MYLTAGTGTEPNMLFDRNKLTIRSLQERVHDLNLSVVLPLDSNIEWDHPGIRETAGHIVKAKQGQKNIVMMVGGHVIRSGVQRYIIDLMEKGYITCFSTNGAGMIHDYEFALIGATTESVARYIKEGQFGLWKETGVINDIINASHREGPIGMGEAIGKAIHEGDFPYKDISIFAACHRLHIPATVHIGIGYDIIHEHPNFDGAASGAASYRDFLKYAEIIRNIDRGVVMNFGSAVMAPEVFLKALSMARNAARRDGTSITDFTTLVCDIHKLPEKIDAEPSKQDASYYFRPWKTMLVRTVADGGRSYYVNGRHAETMPSLWASIRNLDEDFYL